VGGTTTNSTYDGEDRLITAGARTYTHSANGELKTVTEGADTWTYGYDALGNLRTAALPSGTTIEYVIDGRNRRVGRKVNGVLTKGYLWSSGLRVEAELDGGGNVTARYVYGLKSNVPEWLLKGGERYRIITDHLGSPRLVVNATNGAIAQRMDYDSWGNITSDSNPGFQPFGFAGGLYDQDTKLTRFGARDYDAVTGRWTAKDPIGFQGRDTNLYAYVGHDPVNRKDARGWLTMGNMGGTLGVGPNINVPVTVPVRDVVPGTVPQPGKLPCDDAVVPNGNYSEGEEGEKEKKMRRLPAKGKPNSTEVIDNEDGTGQIRDYGPDGNAETDYDFGHHPELGDPHAHDWDWENNPPRGLPRPLRPGE
jgi:RHS repeat-associated protein